MCHWIIPHGPMALFTCVQSSFWMISPYKKRGISMDRPPSHKSNRDVLQVSSFNGLTCREKHFEGKRRPALNGRPQPPVGQYPIVFRILTYLTNHFEGPPQKKVWVTTSAQSRDTSCHLPAWWLSFEPDCAGSEVATHGSELIWFRRSSWRLTRVRWKLLILLSNTLTDRDWYLKMDGVLLKRVTILWVSGILVPKCSSRKSHRNQGCFIYSNGMSKYDTCLLQPWPSRAQLWLPRICNPPVITCDSCFRSLPIPKLIPRPFAGFYQNHWSILQLCPGFPQPEWFPRSPRCSPASAPARRSTCHRRSAFGPWTKVWGKPSKDKGLEIGPNTA